jgi:hypothetical protein
MKTLKRQKTKNTHTKKKHTKKKKYILVLILAFFLKPIDPVINLSLTSYKTNLYLYLTLCACITCVSYITNHWSHNNPQTVVNKPSENKSECLSNAPDDDNNNQVPKTRKNVQHSQNNKCKLKRSLLTILIWLKKLCNFPIDVIVNILSVISSSNPSFVHAKNVNYRGNKSGIKRSLIFFLSSISKYHRSNITMIMLTIVITLVCQGVERNPGPQRRIEIITYNCNGLEDRKKLRRI